MKKLFLVLLFIISINHHLEAQWCGRPCLRYRYYNPGWVDDDSRFYGYIDINDYPYVLPVNCYFNPRPCRVSGPVSRAYGNYTYRIIQQPLAHPQPCSRCNGYH
jgi:hypothetical protein